MLTIGKLGQGQESYYLSAVAEGAEDYYLFAGEAPGQWRGGGAAVLGLSGEVAGAHFTRVLRAEDPRTGQRLGQQPSRVPGFDLTFSAPKSVSILFALGDERLSRVMRDAHDAAVADALAYLEEVASYGRRGHAGKLRIPTSGFVAAVFRHRTSRAGDPNLHSHVVVANRVLGADGRWTALDARALYVQARTAGHLYQASLRHQLRELGVTWTVGRNGLGEIDQVPRSVRREFSRRRQEIERMLAARGLTSATAAQAAALQSRAAKDRGVDPDGLRGIWRERARSLGFGDREMVELADLPTVPQPAPDLTRLLGAEGLTAQASTFGEREVLRAVASALPAGAPVTRVRQLAASLLASSEVVPLRDREAVLRGHDVLYRQGGTTRAVPVGASERRYTTRELLALERAVIQSALAVRGRSRSVAEPAAVERALETVPTLNGEQVDLVRRLCLVSDGVQVVNAPAGSGKTTALGAVVAAYRAHGVHIVGTTLSAKAAGVLRDQAGLSTSTIARFLADLRTPAGGALPEGSVVLVDEAGQVGTRALAEILGAVRRADGKLILVGDPHQLPEIDAGGAYRGLLLRLDAIELTANHRQRDPDEQRRLAELRGGDVSVAMTAYDQAGAVMRGDSSDSLREALVKDWLAAYVDAGAAADARADVVMLGLTNIDVDDLNRRAREHLKSAGQLTGEELWINGRAYQVGDHVVTRRNDRRVGVLNGDRWIVVGGDEAGLALRPLSGKGDDIHLPRSYAEQHPERLQHAYALTVAVSQGSSVERAFVLGSDATYREAGYTAASRARQRTQFYVVGREPFETDERNVVSELEPLAEFVDALSRSAAQTLALDSRDGREPVFVDANSEAPDNRDVL